MANSNEAMREALEELMKFTCNCCQERYCEEDIEEEDGQRIPSPCSVIIKARDALNLGRRNCDVGTAEEQRERFRQYCYHLGVENCRDRECIMCCLQWAQSKADEKGGEA